MSPETEAAFEAGRRAKRAEVERRTLVEGAPDPLPDEREAVATWLDRVATDAEELAAICRRRAAALRCSTGA